MTGHWISEDPTTKALHLESTLFTFHRLRDRHTGESLARTILYLLDRMKLMHKVSSQLTSVATAVSFQSIDWPFHYGQHRKQQDVH